MEDVRDRAPEEDRDERELLEEMLQESVRQRRFPGIGFKGGLTGRRAYVIGTGLDVWEIVRMHADMGRELLLESSGSVSERSLNLALAYYEAYPDEVDAAIDESNRPPEYWHELYPEAIPLPQDTDRTRG